MSTRSTKIFFPKLKRAIKRNRFVRNRLGWFESIGINIDRQFSNEVRNRFYGIINVLFVERAR